MDCLWLSSPEHLSVYLLEVKPHTRLAADIRCEVVPAPDDDLVADLYEDICALALPEGTISMRYPTSAGQVSPRGTT